MQLSYVKTLIIGFTSFYFLDPFLSSGKPLGHLLYVFIVSITIFTQLIYSVIMQALGVCHDILSLGKSPIKWRQRPDMTIA